MRKTKSSAPIAALTITIFMAIFMAIPCLAADQSKSKTTFRPDRAPKFMIPEVRFTDIPIPEDIPFSVFGPERASSTNSPGTVIGTTTYDLQHNAAMTRQISFSNSSPRVHMVWTCQSSSIMPGDRGICYVAYDPGAGYSGSKATGADYAGYAANDVLPGGTAMFVCHVLEQPLSEYHSRYYYENSTPPPDFLYDQFIGGSKTMFPAAEVHCSDSPGVTEDIVYMLTHDWDSDDMILYRKVGSGAWDGGTYIETCTNLSYTIAADLNSDNVAIVYTDDRAGLDEGEGWQTDMDVYYRLSTDQGSTWGDPQNISNYALDSLWRAFAEVSALFTSDGVLHVIWNARQIHSPMNYENYKCRLVHWSSDFQQASFIDDAIYDMAVGETPCDPGAWHMYIAKISISQCDNKLYALYTKYGDASEPGALNDCSEKNYANGELFLAGSDDWGYSWEPPQNLTQTRTPGCGSNNCESDNWASVVRYGMIYGDATIDDTLDIIYINDKDAGAIPQGEGTWCVNNVMHFRFPCRDVDHVARAYINPDSLNTYTLHGEEREVTLEIANFGNASYNIESISLQYLDGDSWIAIGAYSPTMGVGSSQEIAITLNAGGILNTPSTFWHANILIDTDSPSDLITIPVRLLITDEPHGFTCDTLETTTKKLVFCNTGRLGNDSEGASLDIPGDCDADLTSPNGDMYLYDASPMIGWDYNAYTAVYTQWPGEPGTFEPRSDITMTAFSDYNQATFSCSSTDDKFAVDVTLYGPTDGNDFVIAKYTVYPYSDPTGLDDVYLGMILDWDVPSDDEIDNASGIGGHRPSIWQRGVETDPADEDPPHDCPILENRRYAGVVPISELLLSGWTAENAPLQEGSGFNEDSLYNRMSSIGIDIYHETGTDSVVDLHTGITVKKVDLSTGSPYTFVVALATSNGGFTSLANQLDASSYWAEAHGIATPSICWCIPGDANGDRQLNIVDAVYIIGYIFRGGPAPTPYAVCSGDANGDCLSNVGDVVYIIGYIFKGGAPPVGCMEWISGCGPYE